MIKKIAWVLLCCFLIAGLFHSGKRMFFRTETVQRTLPPCFAYFEHLYFHTARKKFFTLGKEVDLSRAICVNEKRKYSWESLKRLPMKMAMRPYDAVPGLTLILLEAGTSPDHFRHYFHFLEHLIGLWGFGGDRHREEVKLFLLAGNGRIAPPENWEGANQITVHLIQALFPKAEIKLWRDFVKERPQGACFEKAILSDRAMEKLKQEPYDTERMLGEYYRYLNPDSLDRMALAVHEYCEAKKKTHEKRVVTYVPRYNTVRSLTPELEKKLLDRIGQISNVEVRVVDFAGVSFQEQIRAIADTDILIGVHGNGLSHALFLPKGAALIELFPKDCLRVEYRIFAAARNLPYFGMMAERGWIDQEEAEKMGVFGEHQQAIDNIDVDAIVRVIEEEAKRELLRS